MTESRLARLLRQRVAGRVLTPEEPDYETARRVWNRAVDRHPAVIVQPDGVADVQAVVRLAAEAAVPVTVRGGGHSHGGLAVIDGGVCLDLGDWRAVQVDAQARTARVAGGARWADFDAATCAAGLLSTGADMPPTGVAGSALGGGFGWLHRMHGLCADNLRAAELVTADGQTVRVDADHDPELWWGLRGGGGAFGVITSLTFALHPMPEVQLATGMAPLERAEDALAACRDLCRGAPDELFARAALLPAPPAPGVPTELVGQPVFAVVAAYFGAAAPAARAVAPLQDTLPVQTRPCTYLELQSLFHRELATDQRVSAAGRFLDGISDGLIEALVLAAGDAPPHWMINLQPGGGAMSRIAADQTAFPHRAASHHVYLHAHSRADGTDTRERAWVEQTDHCLAAHGTAARYANLVIPGRDHDPAHAAYGPNLHRLRNLKTRIDPTNLFCGTPLSFSCDDQIGTRTLYADERVKVWELRLEPGETCAPHVHRHDYLMLYPLAAEMRRSNGDGQVVHVPAGYLRYQPVPPAGLPPHQLSNAGDQPSSHYIIELLQNQHNPSADTGQVGRGAPAPHSSASDGG